MQIAALTFLAIISFVGATEICAQPARSQSEPTVAHPYDRVAPPAPRPAPLRPREGAWPFTAWSYAKAYTFNFFEDDSTQLQVVTEERVWSPYIRSEHLVSEAQARTAAKLVDSINGTFENTKCIFPRHSIVYFDQRDEPIASVNVCFECDGILVWPDYKNKDKDAYEDTAFMMAYKGAITQFKVLFGKDLALPIDYKTDPRPGPIHHR